MRGLLSPRGSRLQLERLEDRNAPATITMSVEYGYDTEIITTGHLSDTENVVDQDIIISGVANGIAVTDENGDFAVALLADSLGDVTATWSEDSEVSDTETLTDTAPIITCFIASEYPDNMYRFYGEVCYNRPFQSLMIQFGGDLISLQGQTTSTDSTGVFDFYIRLSGQAGDNGIARARAVSPWGLYSNWAEDYVVQMGW